MTTPTDPKAQALSALNTLADSVSALEQQWERLRDDPRRISCDMQLEASYLAELHTWYTVALPDAKAELRAQIVGCTAPWRTVLSDADSIRECDKVYAGLLPRCDAACEHWEDLVQLEILGNNHVYFVGERGDFLRRT